jgi:hypothetical protein
MFAEGETSFNPQPTARNLIKPARMLRLSLKRRSKRTSTMSTTSAVNDFNQVNDVNDVQTP